MSFEIIDVPKDKGISGEKIYNLSKDKGYVEIFKKGKQYVIPTSIYCPCCSDTQEQGYDGKLKRKFYLLEKDLTFKLKYDVDTNGDLYAICNSCGFDLRKDISNEHNKIKKEEIERITRSIHINNVKFSNGNYYVDYEDFINFAKSYNEGNSIELIISYIITKEKYNYKLEESCLKDISKFHKNNGKLGIPRRFWKTL